MNNEKNSLGDSIFIGVIFGLMGMTFGLIIGHNVGEKRQEAFLRNRCECCGKFEPLRFNSYVCPDCYDKVKKNIRENYFENLEKE